MSYPASALGQTLPNASSTAAISWSGIPRLYASRIGKQIVLQAAIILLLIEIVFLTEKLNYILRISIEHRVSAGNVFLLLFYTAPRVFDLALPLALMIAVYRVVLRCREDRELLVLASMGIGMHQFVGLAMLVGVAAQMLSFLVSGAIDPRAQYAHRAVLFDAQHEALRGGITPGQFYFFDKYTVYAGPQATASPDRRVFVHHDDGESQRVIVAARAQLAEPDADGRLTLHLYDVVAQDFRIKQTGASAHGDGKPAHAECEECTGSFTSEPLTSMRIGRFAREMALDQLLRFEPRGRTPAEWTTFELLGVTQSSWVADKADLSELGRRFSRTLLCLIAPLFAGVAVALTNRLTQAFALPLACAAVMCLDFAYGGLSSALAAQVGSAALLAALAAVTLAVGLILVRQAVVLQHAIVKPALARS